MTVEQLFQQFLFLLFFLIKFALFLAFCGDAPEETSQTLAPRLLTNNIATKNPLFLPLTSENNRLSWKG